MDISTFMAAVALLISCRNATALSPQDLIREHKRQLSSADVDANKNQIHSYVKDFLYRGASASNGCNEALRRYGSSKLNYSQAQCEADMQQAESDVKKIEEIDEEKAANERREEINKMRAGIKKVESFEDAITVYSAANGTTLASSPKIKPDGKLYSLSGNIDQPDKSTLAFIAKANNGFVDMFRKKISGISDGEPKYFYVRLSKSMEKQYYDLAKIGIGFDMVGKYVDNKDYKTVVGENKYMPIFDVIYFEFWDEKKLN